MYVLFYQRFIRYNGELTLLKIFNIALYQKIFLKKFLKPYKSINYIMEITIFNTYYSNTMTTITKLQIIDMSYCTNKHTAL